MQSAEPRHLEGFGVRAPHVAIQLGGAIGDVACEVCARRLEPCMYVCMHMGSSCINYCLRIPCITDVRRPVDIRVYIYDETHINMYLSLHVFVQV